MESDYAPSNAILRKEHSNEIEMKLILSSTYKGWNFSENILAAKNLSNAPWEFGYALGFSRPLALKASAKRCSLCAQNFIAGVEMYGGLGDRYSFGLHETGPPWHAGLVQATRTATLAACQFPEIAQKSRCDFNRRIRALELERYPIPTNQVTNRTCPGHIPKRRATQKGENG